MLQLVSKPPQATTMAPSCFELQMMKEDMQIIAKDEIESAEIQELKQTGTVLEYITELENSVDSILPESHQISRFLSRLKHEIRHSIRMFRPLNLYQTYALARLQEPSNEFRSKLHLNTSLNTTNNHLLYTISCKTTARPLNNSLPHHPEPYPYIIITPQPKPNSTVKVQPNSTPYTQDHCNRNNQTLNHLLKSHTTINSTTEQPTIESNIYLELPTIIRGRKKKRKKNRKNKDDGKYKQQIATRLIRSGVESGIRKALHSKFLENKQSWVVPVLTFVGKKEGTEREEVGIKAPVERIEGGNVQWTLENIKEDRVHMVVSEEHGWLIDEIYDGFNGPDVPKFLMVIEKVGQECDQIMDDTDDGLDLSCSKGFAALIEDAPRVSNAGSTANQRLPLLSKLQEGLAKQKDR